MFFVGIDIAKRGHEAAVINQAGELIIRPFKFPNSTAGFSKLMDSLNSVSRSLTDFEFGMEATGHYWLNLYCKLTDAGANVHVVNPVQSDALRGLYIRKTKNDSKDAFIIADLIRIGRYAETTLANPDLISLRELTRQRFNLVDCVSDAKRKVIALIDKVFPEYEQLFSDMFGATSLALLEQFPTPDLLCEVSTTKLANFLKDVSRGRHGRSKAEEIKSLASNSFGSHVFAAGSAFALKQFIEQIELLERQITDIEEYIAGLLPNFNQTLTSINGVGTTLSAIFVAEIGDVHRFESPDKLAAFAGIDPSTNSSGEFTGTKARMSKRGSPYLRRAFFLAAVAGVMHNPALKALYDKKRSQGKHHLVALSAVMRKLVNIVYSVLKSGQPYIMVMPT